MKVKLTAVCMAECYHIHQAGVGFEVITTPNGWDVYGEDEEKTDVASRTVALEWKEHPSEQAADEYLCRCCQHTVAVVEA